MKRRTLNIAVGVLATVRAALPAWGDAATNPAAPATAPATAVASGGPRPPAITAVTIKEDREISSDADAANRRWSPETGVEFRVEGAGVAGVTRVADVRVDEAVDDLGNNLLPKDRWADLNAEVAVQARRLRAKGLPDDGKLAGPADAPPPPERKQPSMMLWPLKGNAVEVRFDLDQAPRTATAIKRLRGRFSLAVGGTRRTVTVDKPLSRFGQDLDDPALKEAGVRVALVKRYDPFPADAKILHLRIGGKGTALGRVRVLAADGTEVGSGFVEADGQERADHDMTMLGQPLDDTMRVEIEVVSGQRMAPVEFDMKDLPLP